jgi:glycosyltransferase involved in cell wall biosynthesis
MVSLHGLEDNVRFVKGASEDGLTRHELVKLWSISSVTIDDVGSAWFGSAAIEALALESPVITNTDETFMSSHYGENPFLQASSPEEVVVQLRRLWAKTEASNVLGKAGRSWVERFHGGENVYAHNIKIFERCVKG